MRAALTYLLAGTALAFPLAACDALNSLSGDLILLDRDFFPLVDNALWIYDVKMNGEELPAATMSLTGVTSEDGGITGKGTLTFVISNLATLSSEIRKTRDAVQLEGQQPLLKLPAKVGDSWSAGATSDVLAIKPPQDPTMFVLGTQRIDFSNNGEKLSSPSLRVDLKAFALTEEGTADTTKLKSPLLKRWFIQGVGMVRQTSSFAPLDGVTLDLASHSIPLP